MNIKLSQIRPNALDTFALELPSNNHLQVPSSTMACATTVAHNPDHTVSYKNAKPSSLQSLIPLQTPAGNSDSLPLCVPQSTRGHSLQLPITPHYGQKFMDNKPKIMMPPKTPMQMNFDLMNQALAVPQCPDQMIDELRYGLCIKKTRYRKSQEDRVSTLYSYRRNRQIYLHIPPHLPSCLPKH